MYIEVFFSLFPFRTLFFGFVQCSPTATTTTTVTTFQCSSSDQLNFYQHIHLHERCISLALVAWILPHCSLGYEMRFSKDQKGKPIVNSTLQCCYGYRGFEVVVHDWKPDFKIGSDFKNAFNSTIYIMATLLLGNIPLACKAVGSDRIER